MAQRVAALEQYIQQHQAAGAVESLPSPPGENKESKGSPLHGPDQEATAAYWLHPEEDRYDRQADVSRPWDGSTFDGVTYDDDDATKDFFDTDRNNELGFRSFRIGGKGNIYENLIYNIEVELRGTNSAIAYKDIYMEQQSLPYVGHFRVGHFKEPIGLEEFESDLYLTFMEKSPATKLVRSCP